LDGRRSATVQFSVVGASTRRVSFAAVHVQRTQTFIGNGLRLLWRFAAAKRRCLASALRFVPLKAPNRIKSLNGLQPPGSALRPGLRRRSRRLGHGAHLRADRTPTGGALGQQIRAAQLASVSAGRSPPARALHGERKRSASHLNVKLISARSHERGAERRRGILPASIKVTLPENTPAGGR
jgi:hypothetical protein